MKRLSYLYIKQYYGIVWSVQRSKESKRANGLFSNVGLKTPLSKIPLLVDIFF